MGARPSARRGWIRLPARLAAREASRLSVAAPRRGSATLLVQATKKLSIEIDMKAKKSDMAVEYYSISKLTRPPEEPVITRSRLNMEISEASPYSKPSQYGNK